MDIAAAFAAQNYAAADARQQHDMALSIYSSARDILRTALGHRN